MKREITSQLRQKIPFTRSAEEALSLLHKTYRGETCYIVSCGPSLTPDVVEAFKAKAANKLVIAVKQAYNLLGDVTDFHIYNYINFPKDYKYLDPEPIKIELNNTRKIVSTNSHIRLPIDFAAAVSPNRYQYSIAKVQNFGKFLMDKTPVRPFGPGIMLEMGFYLAHHLGSREIVTIGFDCSDPERHFYGKNEVDPERLKVLQREMQFVANGIGPFANWLEALGTKIKIVSDINPAPEWIERIRIEDIP